MTQFIFIFALLLVVTSANADIIGYDFDWAGLGGDARPGLPPQADSPV